MRLASYIDSQQSKKAVKVVVKWRRPLGCLLFCIGLFYLCSLPKSDLSHKSFFDENALLAGLVRREFSDPNTIAKYTEEIKALGNDECDVLQWLTDQFTDLGLETYTQNFTATRPVCRSYESTSVSGGNVYGIVRSGRSLSTEAIVLAAPFTPNTEHGDNSHGIAVMLTLAKYFKSKNFWAKDLVFLVTSHAEIGMQAWIDGYMGTVSKGLTIQPLAGRSGSIQAVINLELPSATIQYADIITEGVNGILPNLDLVNVVVHLCRIEGIETAFYVQWEPLRGHISPDMRYWSSLHTMLTIAAHQAPGLPLANHGLFLKHRIDSVTVRGVAGGMAKGGANSMFNVARALEGTFRSINNLLEKLHHSEFFYFTTSTAYFVSIGLYMPPFGLLVAPVVMEALAQWLVARDPALSNTVTDKDNKMAPAPPFPFQSVMKLLLSSLFSGVLLYTTPTFISHVQSPLRANSLTGGLLSVCVVSAVLPLVVRSPTNTTDWRMAKVFALIFLILALVATAMMNFSLSVLLALSLIVPAVITEPRGVGSNLLWLIRVCVVGLLCPLLVAVYLCVLYQSTISNSTSLSDLSEEGIQLAMKGIVDSFNAWYFVGSWLYPYVCVVAWPLWLMNWSLVWLSLRKQVHVHSD